MPPAPYRFQKIFLHLPGVNVGSSPFYVYYQIAVGGDGLFVCSENFAQVALDSISDYCCANLSGNRDPQTVIGQPILQYIEKKISCLDLIAPFVNTQEFPPFAKTFLFGKPTPGFTHSPSTSFALSRGASLTRLGLCAGAFAHEIRVSCGGVCSLVEMSVS